MQGGETPNTWAKGLNGSQKQDRVSILLIHKALQKQRAERNKFLVLRNRPKTEGVQRKICKSALPVSPLMQVLGHSDLVKTSQEVTVQWKPLGRCSSDIPLSLQAACPVLREEKIPMRKKPSQTSLCPFSVLLVSLRSPHINHLLQATFCTLILHSSLIPVLRAEPVVENDGPAPGHRGQDPESKKEQCITKPPGLKRLWDQTKRAAVLCM